MIFVYLLAENTIFYYMWLNLNSEIKLVIKTKLRKVCSAPDPDLSVGSWGDWTRSLLFRLLHLIQEAHNALQFGLREQGPPIWQYGVVTQLPMTLKVVRGQRIGVSIL